MSVYHDRQRIDHQFWDLTDNLEMCVNTSRQIALLHSLSEIKLHQMAAHPSFQARGFELLYFEDYCFVKDK